MQTIELIERSSKRLCLLLGSRPGVRYAGLTDREIFINVDRKVMAVDAFVKRHDPDIIFSIAGINSEAQSLGAEVSVNRDGSPVAKSVSLDEISDPSRLDPPTLGDSPLCVSLIEVIGILSNKYPDKTVTATLNGPLTVAGQLLGLDCLLFLSVDDPGLLKELLALATHRIIELLNAQIEAGARYVHVAEPTGSLLSPGSLRDIGLPFLQQLFSQVAVPNHIHMCGDVSRHLKVLAEVGAGAVSVDSMVDMKQAARQFGDDVAVCGNIDSAGLLLRGSPEEVETATVTMLERMASVKAYIPASSCGVPGHTPPENIDSFFKTVWSFGE